MQTQFTIQKYQRNEISENFKAFLTHVAHCLMINFRFGSSDLGKYEKNSLNFEFDCLWKNPIPTNRIPKIKIVMFVCETEKNKKIFQKFVATYEEYL